MSAAPGQAPGGDAGQADGGDAGAPDTGQLAELLSQNQASQQEMFEYLRSEPWKAEAPAAEPEQPAAPELDLSWLDAEDPSFDPNTVAERLGDVINQTVEQRVQAGIEQAVTPLQQAQDEMRRQSEVQALVGEFPEFGEQETGEAVLRMAGQLAEAHGQPELANEPWFWRLTYMAGRAADAAQEESGDVPAPAHLEGGAGAVPGSSGADLGDAIVGARRGASVLPFGP